MAKILMCRPEHFAIRYEINPWMSVQRGADPLIAAMQWEALYHCLGEDLAVDIALIPAHPAYPDLVFTANAGYVEGSLFFRSNFRYPERAGEAQIFEAWFREQGYEVVDLDPGSFFEGEGDLLVCGDKAFAGYKFRSDVLSHEAVARHLGKDLVKLELVDPYFYHLDTCFCPLGRDLVMYYPPAFSDEANRKIEQSGLRRIAIDAADAGRFACNAVVLDHHVVMNAGCDDTAGRLTAEGFRVHQVDTSEFIKAGGSVKCMVLFLERPGAVVSLDQYRSARVSRPSPRPRHGVRPRPLRAIRHG